MYVGAVVVLVVVSSQRHAVSTFSAAASTLLSDDVNTNPSSVLSARTSSFDRSTLVPTPTA